MDSKLFVKDDFFLLTTRVVSRAPYIRIVPATQNQHPAQTASHKELILQDLTAFPSLPPRSSRASPPTPLPAPRTYSYSHIGRRGPFHILILEKLPLELREMVWEARMRDDGHFEEVYHHIANRYYDHKEHAWLWSENPVSEMLPALCFVSRATRSETLGVSLRNVKFVLPSPAAHTALREMVDGTEKEVRELRFSTLAERLWWYIASSRDRIVTPDLRFALQFPGLRTVYISMAQDDYCRRGDSKRGWGVKECTSYTTNEAVAKHRFVTLLGCIELRRIVWDYRTEYTPAAIELASWMKEAFEERKRKLVCEILWLEEGPKSMILA